MYLSVIKVKPSKNYNLILTFENKEKRNFNLEPYLKIGKFQELKNKKLFNTVSVKFDSIEWANNLDIDPEFLYQNSTIIGDK